MTGLGVDTDELGTVQGLDEGDLVRPGVEQCREGLVEVRELRLGSGGFASAQDADTDGVEGLTYTWTEEEGVPAELLPLKAELPNWNAPPVTLKALPVIVPAIAAVAVLSKLKPATEAAERLKNLQQRLAKLQKDAPPSDLVMTVRIDCGIDDPFHDADAELAARLAALAAACIDTSSTPLSMPAWPHACTCYVAHDARANQFKCETRARPPAARCVGRGAVYVVEPHPARARVRDVHAQHRW